MSAWPGVSLREDQKPSQFLITKLALKIYGRQAVLPRDLANYITLEALLLRSMVKTEDVEVKSDVKSEEFGGLLIPKKSTDGVFKVPAPKTSSLGTLQEHPSYLLHDDSLHVSQAQKPFACRSGCLGKEEASRAGQARNRRSASSLSFSKIRHTVRVICLDVLLPRPSVFFHDRYL